MTPARKVGSALVRPLVSIALLGALFWRLGGGDIWRTVTDADPLATGLAILLTIAAVIVSAWKWQLLLRAVDQDVSLFRLSDAYLVGLFFNNFLPSNIGGDVARAHAIGRHTGRLGVVVASIAGERLLAGLALGATASVALVVR
ncbi:MAG: TIGR00374 family protein, partial [Proteobacteria bacterium]|nr:TIGR00374 family protein [Pseudomonadota bacterium]